MPEQITTLTFNRDNLDVQEAVTKLHRLYFAHNHSSEVPTRPEMEQAMMRFIELTVDRLLGDPDWWTGFGNDRTPFDGEWRQALAEAQADA